MRTELDSSCDIFANVLTAMFIFVPATYLRMYICIYIYIYIYIQFFDCRFISKSYVTFLFIEFIFVMVKDYLLKAKKVLDMLKDIDDKKQQHAKSSEEALKKKEDAKEAFLKCKSRCLCY